MENCTVNPHLLSTRSPAALGNTHTHTHSHAKTTWSVCVCVRARACVCVCLFEDHTALERRVCGATVTQSHSGRQARHHAGKSPSVDVSHSGGSISSSAESPHLQPSTAERCFSFAQFKMAAGLLPGLPWVRAASWALIGFVRSEMCHV